MALHGPTGPCIWPYGPTWPYMTLDMAIWPYMALWTLDMAIWPYMALYGPWIWPYTAIYGLYGPSLDDDRSKDRAIQGHTGPYRAIRSQIQGTSRVPPGTRDPVYWVPP